MNTTTNGSLIQEHFQGDLNQQRSILTFVSVVVVLAFFCGWADPAVAQESGNELSRQEPQPDQSMAEFCRGLPRPEFVKLQSARVQLPAEHDWFQVYKVAPGVTAIYEPYQWQEVISYLIEGDTVALLFDTGNGIGDIKAVVDRLTNKPVIVLNSHTHYDHVGGNFAFQRVLGMNTDFTRARQSGHPNKDISIEASPQALCRELPGSVTESTHVGKPFRVTEFLEDGAVIDLGNRQLEVIHIPGHTPDAIALIDRNAGLLWTGDTFYSGPIWLFAGETDLDKYEQSLKRLIKEVPNLTALLPAHNTPWVEPQTLERVLPAFQLMIRGSAERVSQGEGMVEYRIPGEATFSFLMRDEALPYQKVKKPEVQ